MHGKCRRFLVVGLGSMGKRRIRCLQALKFTAIEGFDIRPDRRAEAERLYGILTHGSFENALANRPDALIISVPPDVHHVYMRWAIERGLPFFIEASVVDTGIEEIIRSAQSSGVLAFPSATLLFHPAITILAQIVASGELGRISNVILHSGQYLPDWHTYEHVSDFYVSNPATGGAREIVPFEMTWFTKIFGFPRRVSGNFRKTIDIEGAEKIHDTYNLLLDYGEYLATVTVDVVSRFATRRLLVNGDRKQLRWDWNESVVRVYDPASGEWMNHNYTPGPSASGYNQNISEDMYIDELRNFIDAVEGRKSFPNTLESDLRVLQLLYAVEESDRKSLHVSFLP